MLKFIDMPLSSQKDLNTITQNAVAVLVELGTLASLTLATFASLTAEIFASLQEQQSLARPFRVTKDE